MGVSSGRTQSVLQRDGLSAAGCETGDKEAARPDAAGTRTWQRPKQRRGAGDRLSPHEAPTRSSLVGTTEQGKQWP